MRKVVPMHRRSLFLLFGCLLAPASVGAFQAGTPVVSSVQFAGRVNVGEETCLGAISLKPGAPFTAGQMESDRKALLALGYFRSVGSSQSTTGSETQVTFRLVEWPVVRFIRVLGNTVLDRAEIRGAISTQLGQVLSAPRLQEDIRSIERLYRERGYVARISERLLDPAAMNGILRFEILEVKIADVAFEGGGEKLQGRARKVLREVAPNLYRPLEVSLDQQRLLRIKGVKTAVPKVTASGPGQVRIVWQLNAAS